MAPRTLFDSDELLRPAAGRAIVAHGGPPPHDPLTFSDPSARWCNPEWLGDVLLYLLDRAGGPAALVAYKLCLLALACLLVLLYGRRLGAPPMLVAALVLVALLAAQPRLAARNHLHAYWLLPTYGLVLERARRRPRWLLALLAAGALWANLHASFVLGWLMIGAAIVGALLPGGETDAPDEGFGGGADVRGDAARGRRRFVVLAALLLLAHVALPLLGPNGLHAYDQLLDHARGASLYRGAIREWAPTLSSLDWGAALPLHLLAALALVAALWRVNRKRLDAHVVIAAAVALAYTSVRFAPLLVFLAAPALAAHVARAAREGIDALASGQGDDARQRRLAIGAVIALAVTVAAIGLSRTPPPLSRLGRARVRPARWLAAKAAPGTRLAAPFNAGAHLLYLATPRLRLYIDPRNSLGAAALRRYLRLRRDPAFFERERARVGIELAMIDLGDGASAALANHLRRSTRWQLCYLDGFYAVYARGGAKRARHLPRYRVLQARGDLEYLVAAGVDATARQRELARLRAEAPALALALRGFIALAKARRLGRGNPDSKSALKEASRTLAKALPRLPPSDALMSYLGEVWLRQGHAAKARAIALQALRLFPRSQRARRLLTSAGG